MKAVIYVRVSSERQGAKSSPGEQLRRSREIAKREGYTVIAELTDITKYKGDAGRMVQPSGTRGDRPGFRKLLAMLKSKQAGAVIAWSQDRLARGSLTTAMFQEAVEQGGAKVHLYQGQWDADTAEIMGAVAGFEIRRIRQRMKMGRIARSEEGVHAGDRPFGYKIVRGEDGRPVGLEPIPAEFEVIRRAGKMLLERLPFTAMVLRLPKRATGRLWSWVGLQYMLGNPLYRGYVLYSRKSDKPIKAKGSHALPWSPAEIKAIDAELARRKKIGRGGSRRRKHVHIFASIVHCGYCLRPLAAQVTQSKGKVYATYRCQTPMYKEFGYFDEYNDHPANGIAQIKLLAQLRGLLESVTDEDLAQLFVARKPEEGHLAALELTRVELEGQIAELQKGLEAVRNVPSAAALMQAELDRKETALAGTLAEITGQDTISPERTAEQIEAIRTLKEKLNGTPENIRKDLIASGIVIYVAKGRIV